MKNSRYQVNVRLPEDLTRRIDSKRIELGQKDGRIPSRSEVVRLAVDAYLPARSRRVGHKA